MKLLLILFLLISLASAEKLPEVGDNVTISFNGQHVTGQIIGLSDAWICINGTLEGKGLDYMGEFCFGIGSTFMGWTRD